MGPIDHLSPTSRFKAQSPEQGTRGRERDEVGWGNQLCVAIKLSFLSPSNGLLFPWFWAALGWSMCTAPSLTLSLCPIYGNEPSALSVTAAQIEERLGRGGGSLTDRSLRQRRLSCCVCLCPSGFLQTWIGLNDDQERTQSLNMFSVLMRECNVEEGGYLK